MMPSQQLIARMEARLLPAAEALRPIEGLPDMFVRCFLSTMETTCRQAPDGGAFIITGDIEAMWLRDSTEQVLHYLRFAAEDDELAAWIEAVIARQAALVRIDPYANAFNGAPDGRHGFEDKTEAGPWIWERKYELDSLCHVLLLALRYHQATGRTAWMDEAFFQAVDVILAVIVREQRHQQESPYAFQRFGCPPSDTLTHEGRGEPVGFTGMSWSGFRPSDDACRFGYLIPANLFAAAMLTELAPLAERLGRSATATKARTLAADIREGIQRYGLATVDGIGEIYAYEADGLGHQLLMDDANMPSLLSLPCLGVCAPDDPLYLRTRTFVLSDRNPCYYQGSAARGVGSPHTPQGWIWPISLCVQGLTATDPAERVALLRTLLTTHAGTARMHESFDKDDASRFTRSWFAWANSMFGELVMTMHEHGELPSAVAALTAEGLTRVNFPAG